MELTKVHFTIENHVGIVTMDAPDTLNALDEYMQQELLWCFVQCEHNDDIKAVVYRAEGRAFSGGGDIKSMLSMMEATPRNNALLNEGFAMPGAAARQIRNIRKPVIAVLQGAVAGAAANLALMCDFRIAGEDMILIEAFIKIALVTDGGGVYILNKLIGAAKTTELVMTGRPVKAQEAMDLGLVTEIVPVEELDARAMAFAQKFVAGPTMAYRHMKNLINQAAFSEMGGYLDLEAELQRLCGASDDVLEGMRAFVEKRKPKYIGK